MRKTIYLTAIFSLLLSRPETLGQTVQPLHKNDVRVYLDHSATPDLIPVMALPASELKEVVAHYSADRDGLRRRYDVQYSSTRRERLRAFYKDWAARVKEIDFNRLGIEGRIDHVLLNNELGYEQELLDREEMLVNEMQPLIPFANTIIELDEARRDLERVDPSGVAAQLNAIPEAIRQARKAVEIALNKEDRGENTAPSRIVALRASRTLNSLKERLDRWYKNYAGYDPMFTWWNKTPIEKASKALSDYSKFLNEKVVGFKEGEDPPIVGDPIGADGMRADLKYEMIPYTPEELIAIAEKEFAWCEEEMIKASREMGFGDNWKAALENVKTLHRDPGDQPDLVRDLASEAVTFLRERDLITIPKLADEIWRVEMMSPKMQKVAPFFLGGEVIRVAFPTDGMAHEDKLMSMRGNNEHFARATVHHELIPGHHLQGYMTRRYNSHRRAFSTPFWGEGWALYWEMLLWDLEFPNTPEDRVGMLFWRSHRAARIIFSLSFHLGKMTPQECIDFLVDRVGHERANATAEVRRSFNGSYSPLYQVAYMIGGLQIRALHKALVQTGRMSNRTFHDSILQGGSVPVEMVRARITGDAPVRDFETAWLFYGKPLRDEE